MKKGFFLRLFVLLMLTFFIAEQGRAQTYQRTSQGIKSTVQGINIEHVLMISTMPAQKPSAFINRSP